MSIQLSDEIREARQTGDAEAEAILHALEHWSTVSEAQQSTVVVDAARRRMLRLLGEWHGGAALEEEAPAARIPALRPPTRSYVPSGRIRLDDGSGPVDLDAAYAEAIRLGAAELNRENGRVQLAAPVPMITHQHPVKGVPGGAVVHQHPADNLSHPHVDPFLTPAATAQFGTAGPPIVPKPNVSPASYPKNAANPGFAAGSSCPNCGQQQAGAERFCSRCGSAAPADATVAAAKRDGAKLSTQRR